MLRVHVLGGLRVDGQDDVSLGSRKARKLLGALVLAAPAPISVDRLVELLWRDTAPARPAEQVGVLVSRLRRVLGTERIVRRDAGYALVADWCDLDELSARAREAAEAFDDGRTTAARAAAEAALALGDPTVLPGEDGDWVEPARARAAADVATARRIVVEAAVAAGDLAAAITQAEALLALDPRDEPVTRSLMLAQVRSGRPAAALATYARLRSTLAEELGVSPAADVEALHTAILRGDDLDPAPAVGSTSPLAGRAPELARLDTHLGTLSRARVVVLEGEPGIGKTSLLDAWVEQLGDREVVVLRGRGDPLGRELPLQPVADALDGAVRLRPEVLATLTDADRTELAERLGVGTAPGAGAPRAGAGPADGSARLYAAIGRLLAGLAGDHPVVVVLDDLHHAGTSTLAWVAYVARRSERVLVVGARHVGTAPVEGAEVIPLGPLDREAVATVAGADRADDLLRRSGGHPLLLRALMEAPPGATPSDLWEVVDRQVAALGSAAATVRRAAVLGPEVDLDLVAGIEAAPAAEVLAHLEAGVVAGLLTDASGTLRFRHDLVREALEATVTSARRELIHAEAARRLAARARPDWAAVAVHARAGADEALAATAFRRAAVAAGRRYDLATAESYLDAAVALGAVPEALVDRARVRMSGGDLPGAARDAAHAVAKGGGGPALELAAWVAYYQRHYDEAARHADAALAVAEDDDVRQGAVAVASRVRHGSGDLPGALDLLEHRGAASAAVRGVADVWHAHALVHAGDPTGALRLADRALAVGDGLGQPFAPLHCRFARVMALGQLGRTRDALAACDDLDAAVLRFGDQAARMSGPANNVRSWLLRNLGRHDDARDLSQRARALSGADGAPRAETFAEGFWVALLDLTDGALLRGDLDAAATLLDDCRPMEAWTGTMAWHQRHRLALLRARLALRTGDAETAAAHAHTVVADATARRARRYAALAAAVLAAADPAAPLDCLDDLDRMAGLEGWRHTAEIAAARRNDALRHRAERRVAALLAAARPEDGPPLEALADRVLSR